MNKNGRYHKIAFHSQELHNVCNAYYEKNCMLQYEKVLRLHSIENKKIIRSNIQKAL